MRRIRNFYGTTLSNPAKGVIPVDTQLTWIFWPCIERQRSILGMSWADGHGSRPGVVLGRGTSGTGCRVWRGLGRCRAVVRLRSWPDGAAGTASDCSPGCRRPPLPAAPRDPTRAVRCCRRLCRLVGWHAEPACVDGCSRSAWPIGCHQASLLVTGATNCPGVETITPGVDRSAVAAAVVAVAGVAVSVKASGRPLVGVRRAGRLRWAGSLSRHLPENAPGALCSGWCGVPGKARHSSCSPAADFEASCFQDVDECSRPNKDRPRSGLGHPPRRVGPQGC